MEAKRGILRRHEVSASSCVQHTRREEEEKEGKSGGGKKEEGRHGTATVRSVQCCTKENGNWKIEDRLDLQRKQRSVEKLTVNDDDDDDNDGKDDSARYPSELIFLSSFIFVTSNE